MERWMNWIKGLVSAIIGAAASAVTVVVVDPVAFSPTDFKKLGWVMLVNGIIAGGLYLKQSPLPDGRRHMVGNQAGIARIPGLVAMVVAGFIIIACTTAPQPPQATMCDQVEKSFICEKIRERGWDPAKVRDYIIDVDLAALAASSSYNKTDALSYTARAREIVTKGCSYRYLITWVAENSYKLGDTGQSVAAAGIILISRHLHMFDSTRMMSNGDKKVALALFDAIDAEVERYF